MERAKHRIRSDRAALLTALRSGGGATDEARERVRASLSQAAREVESGAMTDIDADDDSLDVTFDEDAYFAEMEQAFLAEIMQEEIEAQAAEAARYDEQEVLELVELSEQVPCPICHHGMLAVHRHARLTCSACDLDLDLQNDAVSIHDVRTLLEARTAEHWYARSIMIYCANASLLA